MSKIKDFLKSPLGTALCAAAACLLAVVFAFCFLVSVRAYWQGMPIGLALVILSASPACDPAIVLALREIPAEDLRSALAGEDSPSRA